MSATFKAALWMTGAILSFSVMAVSGRELAGVYDTFEIMLYRSVLGCLIVSCVLTWQRRWSEVSTKGLGQQLGRNLAHFTGQNLWFFAVTVIPLAQVFALEFTTPLWVILLAPLVLGERLTKVRLLAVLIGFAGILMVARPSPSTLSFGLGAAAASAVFFALTTMLTKRLTRHHSIGCILFWLTFMQLWMGLIAAGADGDIRPPTGPGLHWLVLVALAGLLAHFSITNALAIAPAAVVAPFDFARLPAIAIIGMLLYDERLDGWVIAGALVIFVGIYLNILAETRKNRVA